MYNFKMSKYLYLKTRENTLFAKYTCVKIVILS